MDRQGDTGLRRQRSADARTRTRARTHTGERRGRAADRQFPAVSRRKPESIHHGSRQSAQLRGDLFISTSRLFLRIRGRTRSDCQARAGGREREKQRENLGKHTHAEERTVAGCRVAVGVTGPTCYRFQETDALKN